MKNDIFNKQNKKYILDALFSQRYYYNLANKLETISLILIFTACVLGSFSIDNVLYQLFVNGVLSAVIFILNLIIASKIKKGALIKKFIDYELFGFDNDEKSIKKAKEYIYDVINKQLKNYQQQISNDGYSNPPGLRDWYYNEKKESYIKEIKSCQMQNITWDNRISKIYINLLFGIFSMLFLVYLIISSVKNYELLKIFAGLIPFMNVGFYLVQKKIKYQEINKIMEEIKMKSQKPITKRLLLDIQKDIDLRRENEFAPPNIIHKIISKKMHDKIKFISK